MTITSRTLAAAAVATLGAALSAAPAHAQVADDTVPDRPVPWHHGFELMSAGGVTNPGVLIGFNPQPEPPARIAELSFAYPPDPILILRDQENPASGRLLFDLFLAVGLPGSPLSFTDAMIDPATPALSTVTTSARSPGGDVLMNFYFDLSSSSGVLLAPGTLVGFNPQPEPPAGYGSGMFGMSFAFTSLSDAMVRVRITDGDGTPLLLSPVPEPRGLMAVGLLALMAWRWWARRGLEAARLGRCAA